MPVPFGFSLAAAGAKTGASYVCPANLCLEPFEDHEAEPGSSQDLSAPKFEPAGCGEAPTSKALSPLWHPAWSYADMEPSHGQKKCNTRQHGSSCLVFSPGHGSNKTISG